MSSSDDEARSGVDSEVDLATFDPSGYRSRSGSFNSSALGHRYSSEKLEWDVVKCVTEAGEDAKVEESTNTLSLISSCRRAELRWRFSSNSGRWSSGNSSVERITLR